MRCLGLGMSAKWPYPVVQIVDPDEQHIGAASARGLRTQRLWERYGTDKRGGSPDRSPQPFSPSRVG